MNKRKTLSKEELEKLPPFNPLRIAQSMLYLGLLVGTFAALLNVLFFGVFVSLGYNPWVKIAVKLFVLDFGIILLLTVFTQLFILQSRKIPVLKLWEGLLSGTVGTLTCAVLSGVLIYFLANSYFLPTLSSYKQEMTTYYQGIQHELEAKKDSILMAEDSTFFYQRKVTLDAQLETIPNIDAGDMAFDEVIKKCIFGFFIVPLTSLILRRK